jgi:hypothetical protein
MWFLTTAQAYSVDRGRPKHPFAVFSFISEEIFGVALSLITHSRFSSYRTAEVIPSPASDQSTKNSINQHVIMDMQVQINQFMQNYMIILNSYC